MPFNDTYINYSRDNLPNRFSIEDLVDRIVAITEKAILAEGGRRWEQGGVLYYEISPQATLTLPEVPGGAVVGPPAELEPRSLIDW